MRCKGNSKIVLPFVPVLRILYYRGKEETHSLYYGEESELMERTVIRLHNDVTQHILSESIKQHITYSEYLNTVITEYSTERIKEKIEAIEKDIFLIAENKGIKLKGAGKMKKIKEYSSGEKSQFHIRMSSETLETVKKEASKQGLTVSAYIENTIRTSRENKRIAEKLDNIQKMLDIILERGNGNDN